MRPPAMPLAADLHVRAGTSPVWSRLGEWMTRLATSSRARRADMLGSSDPNLLDDLGLSWCEIAYGPLCGDKLG